MFRDAQQNGPSRNRPESNNDYEGGNIKQQWVKSCKIRMPVWCENARGLKIDKFKSECGREMETDITGKLLLRHKKIQA